MDKKYIVLDEIPEIHEGKLSAGKRYRVIEEIGFEDREAYSKGTVYVKYTVADDNDEPAEVGGLNCRVVEE